MSCVEVDGAGWSWVLGLVIPNNNIKSQTPDKLIFNDDQTS